MSSLTQYIVLLMLLTIHFDKQVPSIFMKLVFFFIQMTLVK